MKKAASNAAAFADTVLGGLDDTLLADVDKGDVVPASPATIAKGTPERYRVQGTLGEGGMGRVLDATDLWFGRRVALKEILVDAAPPALMKRFMVEALVTGNLEHPGIVAVYERGVRDGRPYYVMRKLHGETLADALDTAKDFRERSRYIPAIVRVAHTIAFAHERGVIHRDLKPENIVLGTHGEVTVIDWGIARVRKLEHLGMDSAETPHVADMAGQRQTVAGAVVGTPAYMAPEQAAGKLDAIDERTDVFALGALLYHVLSGRAPYSGDTLAAQVTKALAVEVPLLASLEKKVPTALAQICERAMAKDPADRFRSATEMADELERAVTNAISSAESRAVNVFVGMVTVVSLTLGILGLAFVFYRSVAVWQEMGSGVVITTFTGIVGLALGILDLATRGRHRLSGLVGAFVALTFMGGILATTLGISETLKFAHAPEILGDPYRFREMMSEGARESIGNMIVGVALAGMQLVVWGIGYRRAGRVQPEPSQDQGP
jgi:hypothetical protein